MNNAKKIATEYYLGLDMGTSSLGWAVTDSEYHLLRVKGKDAWGVRLFPEANTSAERRTNRTARRRLQRERARRAYLKELFADEINKVDPGFLQRLEDSKYHIEDKNEKQPFSLFAGDVYNDKDYYNQYPTIFHLIQDLMVNQEKKDIRLVYLAVLNIYKHRGHFLNDNLSGGSIGNIDELYNSLVEASENFPSQTDTSKLASILSDSTIPSSRRWELLLELLSVNKKSNEAEMLKYVCGLKGTLLKAFPNAMLEEDNAKYSVSFRDGSYEEKEAELSGFLSEEDFEVFVLLKRLHDFGLLSNIMRGEDYLSCARVKQYEKHAADLKLLKAVYKECACGKYNQMFRIMADHNYSAYVGSVNSQKQTKDKVRRGAKTTLEDFFKKITKDITEMQKEYPNDSRLQQILDEIKNESFLPKQITNSNGVIPYQVHLVELEKVLANAEVHYEFLKEVDESGLSVSQRIIEMFKFQIPYYIGPLYNNGKSNTWVVKKEQGKIYPWNFEQKIDVKATSEKFIERMVNHCSYLNGERVLPKCSLLYERFMVLNELNNLKINGVAIDVPMKQDLYNTLFKKGKKVTRKQLISYLRKNGFVGKEEEPAITGIDGDFTNTLANYHKFCEILETETLDYEQTKMVEDVIFWSTIYGDSKKFLREKIAENYSEQLDDAKIKRIIGIRFRDWGRLSREFLQMEGVDKETGEQDTIINRMWNENYNLMECLSLQFDYLERIEENASLNNKVFTDIQYEDLEELSLSAPVKRMVWQTILVVKEVTNAIGCPPAKIFVEMARDPEGKNEKKKKDSRKKVFLELYKSCRAESRDWLSEIDGIEESKFRSKKLYLYYTQKGRCMYTGEQIDIGDLFNDNLYDIDHIYPRHFVKDDSIMSNLVLVKKEKNAHKSDTFPLEADIRAKQHGMWKMLMEGKFITKEKYERLTRTTPFSSEELAQFISRQIVETRQGTKAIAQLFERSFPDGEVVYVKAGIVSDFRHTFDLLKCREVNDLHHANDAYLNIVVGNTYHVKFTRDPRNFIKDYERSPKQYQYHLSKLFEYPVSRGNKVAWITKDNYSINIVKNTMKRNTPLVTKMCYEVHGALSDLQIRKASEAKAAKGVGYIPIKASNVKLNDVMKYGGYRKYTGTCFFLVEHTVKGKKIRTIENKPLYMAEKLKTKAQLEAYCREVLGYEEPSVRVERIKFNSVLRTNGFDSYLTARSNDSLFISNAIQLKLSKEWCDYIKKIILSDNPKINELECEKCNIKLYDILIRKHSYEIYCKRPNAIGDKLIEGRDKFLGLSIYDQVYVIKQILAISSNENQGADLRLIGFAKQAGVSTINKNITAQKTCRLILNSPAGLHVNEIDLLSV